MILFTVCYVHFSFFGKKRRVRELNFNVHQTHRSYGDRFKIASKRPEKWGFKPAIPVLILVDHSARKPLGPPLLKKIKALQALHDAPL